MSEAMTITSALLTLQNTGTPTQEMADALDGASSEEVMDEAKKLMLMHACQIIFIGNDEKLYLLHAENVIAGSQYSVKIEGVTDEEARHCITRPFCIVSSQVKAKLLQSDSRKENLQTHSLRQWIAMIWASCARSLQRKSTPGN